MTIRRSSQKRERNPRGEGQRLRQDIVRAATEILDEGQGEAAVTLRDVARRVGIAAPSIYAHFANREAILLAVVEEAFAELGAHLREALDRTEAGPVPRLHAVCAAYLDFALTWPRRYHILFGGTWNAEVTPASLAEAAEMGVVGMDVFVLLADALRDCADAGDSTSTDPLGDAAGLWVALHGLAQLHAAVPMMPWPPDLLERLVERLALLKSPTTSE